MIGTQLIDSILYFMAFIPMVMVPIVVLQIGPYVVIKGINTLMKADEAPNSAENYFGIEPEEDLLEPDTYKVAKEEFKQNDHTRLYILMKVLGVVTVAVIFGYQYSNGIFQSQWMLNWLMNKMTFTFVMGILCYGASMMALFDQFSESVHRRKIEGLIFYIDGLVIAAIAGVIIATLRF